jgi:hypothetical protein
VPHTATISPGTIHSAGTIHFGNPPVESTAPNNKSATAARLTTSRARHQCGSTGMPVIRAGPPAGPASTRPRAPAGDQMQQMDEVARDVGPFRRRRSSNGMTRRHLARVSLIDSTVHDDGGYPPVRWGEPVSRGGACLPATSTCGRSRSMAERRSRRPRRRPGSGRGREPDPRRRNGPAGVGTSVRVGRRGLRATPGRTGAPAPITRIGRRHGGRCRSRRLGAAGCRSSGSPGCGPGHAGA